jgi:hypothetical protein
MFKYLKKIKIEGEYKSPSLIRKKVNSNYFFAQGNTLFRNGGDSIVEKFEKAISLYYVNSKFLIIYENDTNHLFDIENNSFVECKFRSEVAIENNFESRYISVLQINNNETFCGVFDTESNDYLFKKYDFMLNLKIIERDFFLGEKNNVIYRLRSNGMIFWEYNLNQLEVQPNWKKNGSDKFVSFLGVVNNLLFILSKANRIVVLDVSSGSFVKIIYSDSFPNLSNAFIHPENNYLYCLSSSFVSIDTIKLQIETVKPISNDIKNPNDNVELYNIKSSSFQGDFISFTSYTRFRSGFAKWIGLYSYTNEEIIWHHELLTTNDQVSFPAFESPQLVGRKLYVLDTDNMLHIMEKTSSNE